ncbi:MAG: hypothetical protein U5J99_06530 [Parvularculaceae bacterium]|nr:hypothetical protein [Parvularculaceae bacterium]
MRLLAIFLIAVPLAASCGREPDTKAFAEAVSPTSVRSERFGITADKPEGWYALSEELQSALVDGGAKVVSEGNDAVAGAVEAGMARTTQIFGVFKHEPGSPVEFNPNVLAIAENVKIAPGVKTGSDYFYQFKKLATQTNAQYEFKDETTVKIGGRDFTRLDLTMSVAGQSADQSYYAARMGDEMILLIQSYKTDAERAETEAIVQSVRFDK